ncbi:bifunctional folylpolyglutamate synthase/dihydrofolate synthase [Novosphingobium lentum]|uniref:bifunctional folylpolyglutamate synthase/dihydrofolate synthase n=1 Tax=Novosphingobium lentum TaxID=145287 RepID=UPI00082B48F1|nr:folylpolyglutamate synthase/dihydrofolate synthase family protein [Novosphingobium lentum]
MRDFAISDNPAVQGQLNRLAALSLPQGRLSLDTIRTLLNRLDNPHRFLPPVFHVAGTNGKGSTCAYLRAMLEAQGLTVHAATKPHLVRYNERIRIAGRLIEDALLAALLKEVLNAAKDLSPSFFEVTAAATFLAFARIPADACIIETGLGGRLDATNVIDDPAVCGIATLGLDHEAFLLSPEDGVPTKPLARIAFEKASIAKPGVPLVTMAYPQVASEAVDATARQIGATVIARGRDWWADAGETIAYRDAAGALDLPLPSLPGKHQADNAALAVAMLRHQQAIAVSPEAMTAGIVAARWPARLQRLGEGPLTALAQGRPVWLDGGHNPDAGAAIAQFFAARNDVHLIIGMLPNKDPSAIVAPLAGRLASVTVVPIAGHASHGIEAFVPHASVGPRASATVPSALRTLPPGGEVLVAGSLYLAGEVLRLNGELPD